NGIKFFNGDGLKLPDAVEDKIEDIILNKREMPAPPIKDLIGRVYINKTASEDYKQFLKEVIRVELDGIKVAMDCGHGALYRIGPAIINELGGEVYSINTEPNGM